MPRSLRSRFLRFVRAKQLIAPGERVLIATSGGIDSMVLLHLLKHTSADLQIDIAAAHFDHAMRESSASDASWLSGVCAQWNVRFVTERAAVPLRGETNARDARYAFLDRVRKQLGADKIATAHHADDQIETVLFRLMRGAGLRGLSGIPIRRGMIIRPLIPFTKRQLEQYALANGIEFRFDETNATDMYARNRIRRALIPVLESIRPDAGHLILHLARHAARTEKQWRGIMRQVCKNVVLQRENTAIELARDKLLGYDPEIRARVLRTALRGLESVPDKSATDALMRFVQTAESGRRFDVTRGVRAERAYDTIRLTRDQPEVGDEVVEIVACNNGGGVAAIRGCRWSVDWTTSQTQKGSAAEAASFDCKVLRFPLTVRAWRPGDRIRMPYGTKKLKKLFAEHRVPFHVRSTIPVIAEASGRVLWIPKIARSTEAMVDDESSALTITVSNAENS